MNIETEVRSFVTKEQYDALLTFFKEHAELVKEDAQESYFFDCEEDLRIQKNEHFAKVWLKKGKVHDEHREEIEIRFEKEDFEKLETLFTTLGYTVEIKWFRKRYEFLWKGITVCLDSTKGYGDILELEKMCTEEDKEEVYAELQEKLASLHVDSTPREVFEQKYQYYKEHWRNLV